MAWSTVGEATDNWVVGGGSTVWDGGLTAWDLGDNVAQTIWDAQDTAWADKAEATGSWSEL